MPMFQSFRLNGVATIEITCIHTYPHKSILPNLGNRPTSFFFAVTDTRYRCLLTVYSRGGDLSHIIASVQLSRISFKYLISNDPEGSKLINLNTN